MATTPVTLAEAPRVGSHDEPARWTSDYEVDPWSLTDSDSAAPLLSWSERLLAAGVDHVDASSEAVRESTYYADLAGSATLQQRVRIQPNLTAVRVDRESGAFDDMTTTAPPTARGWEYMTGTGWDWDAEVAQMPAWLEEKMAAPSVEARTYDLVIDPTNLWLTIHESVGHATELDRALGYEANYAGTSFATPDRLGTLQYGSGQMSVTGDRQTPHGLATIGWDDEGVGAQRWDIIRDGVLVGYQLDRAMAGAAGVTSNGCAYADSGLHVPLQRMPNVSLEADPAGGSVDDLIAQVEDGLYIVGDKSWSIDMQRFNFQFTGQRFFRIRGGQIVGMVRDVAYQSNTLNFWGALEARGGPSTYLLGGAFNCGKGQPGQVASVSHGAPAALFRSINVLNTVAEAGR
jgi:TldD protein